MNVLLVEDNRGDMRIMEMTLARILQPPMRMQWADRLSATLDLITAGGIEVILLDLGLPDSQGLSTLQKILAAAPGIPVIILTSNDSGEIAEQAIQGGAQDYIVKGEFDEKLLCKAMLYAIQREKTISALKHSAELEEQLRQAHKMEAIGQLAGGMAHDFNNILGAISGYAELLSKTGQLNEKQTKYLEKIGSATIKATQFINQLLTFSRRAKANMRELDICQIVISATDMLSHTLGSGITVRHEGTAHPLLITGDDSLLENALINLGVNARDAMPRGGTLHFDCVECKISSARPCAAGDMLECGSYASITVTDTGLGIDPKIIPRIFEPFFTTKVAGKGTGLGLASVYGCVKQCHGAITVESEVGVGTRFVLYFPLNEAAVGQGTE